MKTIPFRFAFIVILFIIGSKVYAQSNYISFRGNFIYVGDLKTAQVEIIEPSSKTFKNYVVEVLLLRQIDVKVLNKIAKAARTHYSNKLDTKRINFKVLNWGEPINTPKPDSTRNAQIDAFYDYIYQRLETEELSSIEGIFESIDEGNDYEYLIVILKSMNEKGSYVAYLLGSTDPSLPVASTLLKLRPTAVPNKYLTQYWLKSGYTTSNELTVYSDGIINAGPKSYIKMYPGPNETRKYREINPLVDWDACGSGVLLGPGGIIATNYHVIKGADKIRVKITDSLNYKEYKAELIAQDIETDVAILRVIDTTANFIKVTPTPLNFNFTLGDEVMTLGYPIPDKMGENVKFNKGYISALSGNENNEAYFQTDLPVWYGNSGGPCFDERGNLLGLVSEIRFDKGQKLENVCFVTRAINISSLLSTTKYNQNIQLKEATEPANMDDLIGRSVFIKVNY